MGLLSAFDKVLQYNNLGYSLNNIYGNLHDIEERMSVSFDMDKFMGELFGVAFLFVKGVSDRIEKFNYNLEGKIVVPQMSSNSITLYMAVSNVLMKLDKLQTRICSSEADEMIKDILEKGKSYYKIEKDIPKDVMKNLIRY